MINSLSDNNEIDLKGLVLKLKSYWYIIIIGALLGVLLGVWYKAISTKDYMASAMIYLRGADSSLSLQDLQIGSELTKDYEIILKSRPNLEKVINSLNLSLSYSELETMINIKNPENTRILKVEVVSEDPNLSMDIANEVINFGMDSIREIDSQEPYLIEKAILNTKSISISLAKSILLGFFIGALIGFLGIVINFIIRDNIKSVDDIERNLGLPVLAVVLEDKELNYYKKNSNSKKLKRGR